MQTTPDGKEVVATRLNSRFAERPPLLIVDAVVEFMDSWGLGSGALSWARIGEGQSNITYKIARQDEVFVLRRGPLPPLPKSAHDMIREAHVQQLLKNEGLPVPEILAICEDESVLGVPFYIMSFLGGTVITGRIPANLNSREERVATSVATIDALVQLHQVDVSTGDLARFGRPAGYLQRQISKFSALWESNATRVLSEVVTVREWLEDNVPVSQKASVIHGDFRMGNLMFAETAPASIQAILDWEMATIGDPLADLGYFTATYAEPGSPSTPLDLTPVTRGSGYLTRRQLIARYDDRMNLDLSSLHWYQALAMWKGSIFCEAIYARWRRGERPNDTNFAPSLGTGVPNLLRRAEAFAHSATNF